MHAARRDPFGFPCQYACRIAAIAFFAAMAWAPCRLSWAQNATAVLSPGVKSAAVMGTGEKASIDRFLDGLLPALVGENPTEQATAREALASAPLNGDQPGTPAFLNAYAAALNARTAPVLQDSQTPPRAKLNVAIVVARVAQHADNAQLLDSALAMLADKSEPVVLWGLKAARWVLPPKLRQPGGNENTLTPAIVGATKTHAGGELAGLIITEAYQALSLDVDDRVRGRRVEPAMIQAVLPSVREIVTTRIDAYEAAIPSEPLAERVAFAFLVNSSVWAAQDAAGRAETVQALSDLLSLATAHAQAAARGDASQELAVLISSLGGALMVVADADGLSELQAIAAPVQQVRPTTPPGEIRSRVEPVYQAIAKVPAFKDVKPPPQLSDAAAPDENANATAGQSTDPATRDAQ